MLNRTKYAIILLIQMALSLSPLAFAQKPTDGTAVDFDSCADALSAIHALFSFPAEADFEISYLPLRKAIYEAFDRKDFYTGRPITFEELRIDHVVPVNKGGKNNYFNYVATSHEINMKKMARFDSVGTIAILSVIRLVYASKVKENLLKAPTPRDREKAVQRIAERNFRKLPEAYPGSTLFIKFWPLRNGQLASTEKSKLRPIVLTTIRQEILKSPKQPSFTVPLTRLLPEGKIQHHELLNIVVNLAHGSSFVDFKVDVNLNSVSQELIRLYSIRQLFYFDRNIPVDNSTLKLSTIPTETLTLVVNPILRKLILETSESEWNEMIQSPGEVEFVIPVNDYVSWFD